MFQGMQVMTAKQRKLAEMNRLPARRGHRVQVEEKQEEVRGYVYVCVCVCV